MPPLALGALIVLAGLFPVLVVQGRLSVLAAVVVVQAALLLGWRRLPLPAAGAGAGVALVAGAAADILAAWSAIRGTAPWEALVGVLGLAVMGAFLVQLLRRDGRADATASAAAAITITVITVAGTCWALTERDGALGAMRLSWLLGTGIVVGGVAVAARRRPLRSVIAVAVGGALGLAVFATLAIGVPVVAAVPAAVAAPLLTVAAARVAGLLSDDDLLTGSLLASTVPVLLTGPLLLGLDRLAGG